MIKFIERQSISRFKHDKQNKIKTITWFNAKGINLFWHMATNHTREWLGKRNNVEDDSFIKSDKKTKTYVAKRRQHSCQCHKVSADIWCSGKTRPVFLEYYDKKGDKNWVRSIKFVIYINR